MLPSAVPKKYSNIKQKVILNLSTTVLYLMFPKQLLLVQGTSMCLTYEYVCIYVSIFLDGNIIGTPSDINQ